MKRTLSGREYLYGPWNPPRYGGCSLDNFEGGDWVVRFCRDYVKDLAAGTLSSVFFTGPCGSGKTHLAVAILKEVIKDIFPESSMFLTVPEFIADLRDAISTNRSEQTVFSRVSGKEFVVLDDFGAGKLSEYTAQSLFLLIDRCYRNKIVTITTSNLSLEQIDRKLDPRIASRLAEGKVIQLDMPDYRRKRS